MPALDHKFVSLPLAMTGPVGRPVGEPPGGSSETCPFRKSYPDVFVMQSGQDWNGDNATRPLDGSTRRRIFL